MEKGRKKAVSPVWIILCAALAFALARLFLLDAAIVEGRSMLPRFRSGDIVLVWKAAYGIRNPLGGYWAVFRPPAAGDIVAALKPGSPSVIIKRVFYENGAGGKGTAGILLIGDNVYESVDSREFGPVPMSNILGRIIVFPRRRR